MESLESRQLLSAADDYLATMAHLQSLADGAAATAQFQINETVSHYQTTMAGANSDYTFAVDTAVSDYHSAVERADAFFRSLVVPDRKSVV